MPHLVGPLQMPPLTLTRELAPEKRLLLALLQQAILDWWGFRRAKERGVRVFNTGHVTTEIRELKSWFEDEESEPWSFRWVCAAAFREEDFAVRRIRDALKITVPKK